MNKHFRVSGGLFSKLEELGVPPSAVLRRAGLPLAYVDQPRVLVSTEEFFAFWRTIGEVSTNPAIGLLLGTETKTERFQAMGLAALSTETLRTACAERKEAGELVASYIPAAATLGGPRSVCAKANEKHRGNGYRQS